MAEWRFVAENPNPIVGYTVGFEFQRPLGEESLKALSDAHSQFRRELPRRNEQRAVTLQFGGPPLPTAPAGLGGVVFSSFKPDGTIGKALSVVQQTASFMIADYQRWAEFWPQAERLLRVVAEYGLKEAPITALILLANNRFEWSAIDEKPDFGRALKGGSQYVTPHMLSCQEAAHSFHGYFAVHAEPHGSRLDNVMISAAPVPSGGAWQLDINFSFRLTLVQPVADTKALFGPGEGGSRSWLQAGLESLHKLNNQLFKETVAPSIVQHIPGLSC